VISFLTLNFFPSESGHAGTERSKQKSVSRKDAKDAKKSFKSWF